MECPGHAYDLRLQICRKSNSCLGGYITMLMKTMNNDSLYHACMKYVVENHAR